MRPLTGRPETEEKILGTAACARAAGVARETVISAIHAGQLQAYRTKPNGGHFRIKQSWYEAWMESLQISPDGPADVQTASA